LVVPFVVIGETINHQSLIFLKIYIFALCLLAGLVVREKKSQDKISELVIVV